MEREHAFVAVVTNLTKNQAVRMSGMMMNVKNEIAPKSRGTMAAVNERQVGRLIQNGKRRIEGGK